MNKEEEKPVHLDEKNKQLVKNPILQLAIVLLMGMAYLTWYSYSSIEMNIGSIFLKKADVKEMTWVEETINIPTDKTKTDSIAIDSTKSKDSIVVDKKNPNSNNKTNTPTLLPYLSDLIPPAHPLDTNKLNILLMGDSQLEGFMPALNNYCKENGHKLHPVMWYSSSTLWWGQCDTMSYYINKFKPNYIIVVLGLNELFIPKAKERKKYVEHILAQAKDTRLIWVGPAAWKKDTGINELIKSTVGEDRYYESKNLILARAKDGAHPTRGAAKIWMDSVAVWIGEKSRYPIQLKKPTKTYKRPGFTVLQPTY